MIETLPKLKARILAAAVLSLAAACNVSASGQIPCVDDSSCPATYPVCKAGFCAEGAAGTNGNASVAVLGVPGKNATDPLRGTVTVQVVAKASSGVKSISLATGSNIYAPATDSAPPVYRFPVDTTKLADGSASFIATVTPGDSTQAAKPSDPMALIIDNTPATLTIGAFSAVEVADGTLVAIDVTSNKQLSSITGAVSGSTTALAQLAAPTGFVYHFGYAVTAGDAAGAHSVSVSGVDLAGNSSSASNAAAFNVRHPFAFGLLTLNTGHTVNEASSALPAATAGTTVSVSVSLPVSATLGTAKPVFKLTSAGGPVRTLTAPTLAAGTTAITWSTTYVVVAGDNDGLASVTVAVSDLAGNSPTPATASLVIDKTPPLSTGAIASGVNFDTVHNTVVITTIASKRLQSASIAVSNLDAGTCLCDGGACNASTSLTPLVSCTVVVSHAAAATVVATLALQDTLGNSSTGGTSYQAGYTVVAAPSNGGLGSGATIGQGQSGSLMPSFSNGVGVVTGNDGSSYLGIKTGIAIPVSPNAPTVLYLLVVTNAAGTFATSTGTTITVVPSPTIATFSGPTYYVAGQFVGTLTAIFTPVTGATATVTGYDGTSSYTCTAAPDSHTSPASFTCQLPANNLDVTYTLTVVGGPVSSTATLKVKVTPDPASSIVFIVSGASPINPGGTTTFSGTVCTGCTASISPSVAIQNVASGALTATTNALQTTTAFTLTVTNQAGASATLTRTVTVRTPTIASFNGPTYVAASTSFSVVATFGPGAITGATAASAAVTGASCGASNSVSPHTFTCVSGIAVDTSLTLTVTLGIGANNTLTVTLPVKVASDTATTALNITGPTATINPGDTTTLGGTVCAGCTFTLDPVASINGIPAVSIGALTATTNALQATTAFTLTVTNQAGVSATATRTVTVRQPTIASFTGPVSWTAGKINIILSAAFAPGAITGATAASAAVAATLGSTPTCSPGSSLLSPQTFTCGAITQDTTFTLTVTLGTGTATATVIVKVAPTQSLTVSGPMNAVRFGATLTLLPNGKVLIAGGSLFLDGSSPLGSAEVYDPATGNFLVAGAPLGCTQKTMSDLRYHHTATLLGNGKVLLAGGTTTGADLGAVATTDLYDTASDCFIYLGPNTHLLTARSLHTAALLPSGKVLIAGGLASNSSTLSSAEIFDPLAAANQFTLVTGGTQPGLTSPRSGATATPLNNGLVLIAGGNTGAAVAGDLFNYAANPLGGGQFAATAGTEITRRFHTATLLGGGKVLLTGGSSTNLAANVLTSAEVYDPNASANAFTTTTFPMNTGRYLHSAVLLPAGTVLVVGGSDSTGAALQSTELFDLAFGKFSFAANMSIARSQQVAAFLFNGSALVAGGVSPVAAGELFTP